MRMLTFAALAAGTLIVVGLIALHTNPIQSRLLTWSIGELERRFDLDLSADDLHYNLASRRVVLTHVRLAATGHRDNPFFIANTVTVRLPWAVYGGTLRFDEINVDRGVVTITRDENDGSNLPPGRGQRDPNAPPRRLEVRGLTVNALNFIYQDRRRAVEIKATDLSTTLHYEVAKGAVGPFNIAGGVEVRTRLQRVTVDPVKGRMAFDRSKVSLDDVGLATSEGTFVMRGAIDRVLDQPTLNLNFQGKSDLSVAEHWTTPPVNLSGPASIQATMTGAPSQFVLDSKVLTKDATVGTEKAVAIDAEARLTPNGVTVSRSTIVPATGGTVEATADVGFGQQAPWWVAATWRGLDAASAFRLSDVTPLAFGAALTGNARIDRTAGEPFRLQVHNESTPRSGAGTAPIGGVVDFLVERDRWRANQSHRVGATSVDGPIRGVWNRQSVTQSTFEGELVVRTEDVGEAARYAALFGLTTPEIVRDATGPVDATVQIGGVFSEPRFTGNLASSGITVAAIGSTTLSANIDVSARALKATDVEAAISPTAALGPGQTNVRGAVSADLVGRGLTGQFSLDTPSAADLLGAVPEAVRLDGPLTATATLTGTLDAPAVLVEVKGSGLTLADQPIDSIDAKTRIADGQLIIESFTLRQSDGSLTGTGRYSWSTRTYAIDVTGQDLKWRGTLARLGDAEARVGLKFAGTGDIDHPTGVGAVEYAVSGGLAGELIDKGIANVRLDGESARVTGTIPSLGAFINATIQPRQPFDYESVIVMNRIDLAPVATLAGLEEGHVTGSVSLSASAKGQLASIRDSRAFVNLQDINADVSGVPMRLASPSRLSWDGSALSIDNLDVTVGAGRLTASGRLAESGLAGAKWTSAFKGRLDDVIRIGRPFGVPTEVSGTGPISFSWQSSGGLEQSIATVQVSGGAIAWGALPPVTNLMLEADFDGTSLDVTRLTGQWQEGGIEGTASIPRSVLENQQVAALPLPPASASPGFAKLRVTGLTESSLAPFFSSDVVDNIDGRASATLDARISSASLEGVTGSITLDEADLLMAGVKVAQVRPSVLDIRGGVVTFKDVAFDAGGSPLTLTGTAHLTPPDKQTLDLNLQGTVDLRIVSAFAPTVATNGEAKLNMGIGGALRAPVFSGRIDLADAEMAIREPRILVSEVTGTIALDGQRVLFDSIRGSINGGGLTLDGGLLLEGFAPGRGGLTVVIDGAALEYPTGLQSEADAIVTLAPSPTGWTLTGDINIERSTYTETISLPALIAARRARIPAPRGDEPWAQRLRLNLFVTTLQDLRIDNNYGRLEASSALRVSGTLGDPGLSGRITLREGGEAYLAGNTFYVSRGSISFINPNRIVPELDLELRTLISGADIMLTLQGSLDRLDTDVRSTDPSVDSREAMAMLLGGSGEEAAAALLTGELLGPTGRALGLDTLRVQRGFEPEEFRYDPGLIATETDPSTRLTLSKRLRPDTELIFSQSLRESGGLSAIIAYKPRRNIEVRAITRDNLDRSLALNHEITFGGNASIAVDTSKSGPEVSGITFSGEPDRPTEQLRKLLELEEGETFEFHIWQRDVDRLRESYQNENYYEARVRGIRNVSEDNKTVALEYRIEPGPISEFVIEGHPLEPELERAIREVWRRTIFDRFLIEDIESRILHHLMEENLIGSKVEVVVAESTPQRKQIRVSVTPGVSVSRRSIQYSGNRAFDRERLDAVVLGAGFTLDEWLDSGRLIDAIATFYRDEGYLDVAVKAEPPAVQGDHGVLPVSITEGNRYVVGRLTLPGVSPDRLASVAAAARLDSGVPYRTADLDAARQRVEEYYALAGFNTVQIEVEPEPDRSAGSVALEFAILEGVQQILQEVSVEGATRTRDGVVLRALRLAIGHPVNLVDWSLARKRLYDTNVFQQVDIQPVPLEPTTEQSAAAVQPVRAVVRVVEYPVWRFRYGLQYNDEKSPIDDPERTEPRLQSLGVLADLQNQNLWGRAITAGISGRYERSRQAASVFTSNSSFFGLPIRSSGFVFGSRQRFENESLVTIDQRFGVTAEQRWRPFRYSEVIWGYRFERQHVTLDPVPVEIVPLPIYVATLTGAVALDRRDDPTNPQSGWLTTASWDQALQALGSDYTSGKLLLQQSVYREMGGIVVAGRVQLGTGYGGDLVFSERFKLGGATTVRGYSEASLGPRDAFGIPVGGDALLALNGELRFPIRGWIHGVAFIDAGNVFATRQDLSFGDLAAGYGFGIRFVSPYALLRVDFGIPGETIRPERPANQFKSGRWYFGIGHVF
jgi:outer membrane protein assembly complex protein YaeT